MSDIDQKSLAEQVVFYKTRYERLEQDYNHLLHQTKQLLRDKFGRKSERYADPTNPQQRLFDDGKIHFFVPTAKNDQDKKSDNNNVVSLDEKRRQRKPKSMRHLPERTVIIPAAECDKQCTCGRCKTVISYDRKELLHYVPPVYEIIVQLREILGCPLRCAGSVKTAPKPPHMLPKAKVTESLLAHIIVSKCDDRQPLYHLEQQLKKRYGVAISRQTLARWSIDVAIGLQPFWNLLKDEVIDYDIASCDPTSLQVLRELGRPPTRKSYVYCMRGGVPDKKVILYEYNATEHQKFMVDWFAGFQGTIHSDADNFFEDLAAQPGVDFSHCNAHARRKFEPIAKAAATTDGLSHHAMAVFRELYRIERYAKEQKMTTAQRHSLRQKESRPIMDEFKTWLDTVYPTVLPKSSLGKAIAYCLNHWIGLIRFLEDGRLEIDNNHTEQEIKPFVIARKNFLFACSVEGAQALCIHFSLIRTAKLHGLDPYHYYVALLTAVPHCKTVEDYERLLPWNIQLEKVGQLKKAA